MMTSCFSMALLGLLFCSVSVSAQQDTVKLKKRKTPSFLSAQEYPDHARYLPVPPATDSMAFMNDAYFYQWGKQQRTTALGVLAAIDQRQPLAEAFASAAGFTVNADEWPEVYRLVEGARKDAHAVNLSSKDYFHRLRPFAYYREPSLAPRTDSIAAHYPGYPSGHATRGWVYALVLALVVPDSTEALLRRAQEYALGRVICGRHYKSDVDASLVEANALMCRLLSNDAFLAQLQRARQEYAVRRRK